MSPSAVFLTLLLLSAVQIHCYPNGDNVDTACNSLTPGHGVNAQTSSNPYKITFSPASYTPGVKVTVTISTLTGSGFKGFMIQARKADDSISDGSWDVVSGTKLACNEKALVHADNTLRVSLTSRWTPPSTLAGNIIFKAAIVQSKLVFWTRTESAVLTPASTSSTTFHPITTKSSGVHNTTLGPLGPIEPDPHCGKTKGCFGLCANGGCIFLVTWTVIESQANYTLASVVSQSNPFIALGFSNDLKMGDDSVIGCAHGSTGSNYKFTGLTTGRVVPDIFIDSGVILKSTRYSSGMYSCNLLRPITGTQKLFDVSKEWTLFFATGPATIKSGTAYPQYHDKNRYISEKKVSITSMLSIRPLTKTEEGTFSHGLSIGCFRPHTLALINLVIILRLVTFP
ncbi:hypothetical protein Btru_014294 [Bulinus truncatus]|nr:hypothetical protein Btru_014294 [Bulinus truncatus]